jgi:hypothetical protein
MISKNWGRGNNLISFVGGPFDLARPFRERKVWKDRIQVIGVWKTKGVL